MTLCAGIGDWRVSYYRFVQAGSVGIMLMIGALAVATALVLLGSGDFRPLGPVGRSYCAWWTL
jgi:hypothetical protein